MPLHSSLGNRRRLHFEKKYRRSLFDNSLTLMSVVLRLRDPGLRDVLARSKLFGEMCTLLVSWQVQVTKLGRLRPPEGGLGPCSYHTPWILNGKAAPNPRGPRGAWGLTWRFGRKLPGPLETTLTLALTQLCLAQHLTLKLSKGQESNFFFFFEMESSSYCQGWSIVVWSQLTAASTS